MTSGLWGKKNKKEIERERKRIAAFFHAKITSPAKRLGSRKPGRLFVTEVLLSQLCSGQPPVWSSLYHGSGQEGFGRASPQKRPACPCPRGKRGLLLGPPLFGWEGSPTKIDYRKKGNYPYSNLCTGGPSLVSRSFVQSLLAGTSQQGMRIGRTPKEHGVIHH